ncbi:MAG: hypothetical protein C9356_11845 [Oleiphilus sp.]|nr:MAG: hypothetical protein C9356_11845 [Oleiphilus sp.]
MTTQSDTLSLFFRLINTLHAPSFKQRIKRPWKGAQNANRKAIQEKATSDLCFLVRNFGTPDDLKAAHMYLKALGEHLGVTVKAAATKGLIKGMSLPDYQQVEHFLCHVSAVYRPVGELGAFQFACHEQIRALMDYFLLKDSLENGTGHEGLDKLIAKLITNKSPVFFSSGYLTDIFVIDRIVLSKPDSAVRFIRCHKDYLSTQPLGESEARGNDPQFEIHQVA